MARRDDTNGPIIRWLYYGYDGWQPDSFDTIKEAVEAERYGTPFLITRVVEYEVQETQLTAG